MPFDDFDLSDFWTHSEYATKAYVDVAITPVLVERVEQALGYALPAAYVALMQTQNGGLPRRTCHPMAASTGWAEDYLAITGIHAIGESKRYSLLGEAGTAFWVAEWEYPAIGVYFANCPSAGHDMLCLDYRACGPTGEPTVVHVDQESDYAITLVAPTFEAFIRGLADEDEFDD